MVTIPYMQRTLILKRLQCLLLIVPFACNWNNKRSYNMYIHTKVHKTSLKSYYHKNFDRYLATSLAIVLCDIFFKIILTLSSMLFSFKFLPFKFFWFKLPPSVWLSEHYFVFELLSLSKRDTKQNMPHHPFLISLTKHTICTACFFKAVFCIFDTY